MKKVLVAGAALMLAGSLAAPVDATAAPGVSITGNARARVFYKGEDFQHYGNIDDKESQLNGDSRVRFEVKGEAAGGAYALGRIRLMDGTWGDNDKDSSSRAAGGAINGDGNIWVDKAYIGIPFSKMFTLETGKYRTDYGNGFMYNDINASGFRGIVKVNDFVINPFLEWAEEAQADGTTLDKLEDNDAMRYGVNITGKLNADWKAGLLLGFQSDERNYVDDDNANEGMFASLYASGKVGAFGLEGELSYNDAQLNGFMIGYDDKPEKDAIGYMAYTPDDDDDGIGGYIRPSYVMNALTLSLDLGFTQGGYQVDQYYGWVMIGGELGTTDTAIGLYGDWFWIAPSATYKVSDALSLTGNIVYASIDSDDDATGKSSIEDALELSGNLKYTISKGADFYWYLGYMMPSFDDDNYSDDASFVSMAKFEIKF